MNQKKLSIVLFKPFNDNYMKINSGTSPFLISGYDKETADTENNNVTTENKK